MASIKVAKKIIEAGRKSNVSVWLWGPHGIGKSESVEQVAKSLDIEFIDIRAALTEAGDWMGLPFEDTNENGDKYARFATSSFLPLDPDWKGIIFLDELNRARPDVLNCVFQLVLNRKIMNHYELPKGASIVAAGNPSDAEYDVTSVDPALLGRFCHVSLTPSRDEWLKYSKEHDTRDDIIKYITNNKKMLEMSIKGFDLQQVKPNRRGWTMLSTITDALESLGYLDTCLEDVASGLVGTSAAVSFAEFRRSNFLRIDVTKILKDYESIRKDVLQIVKEGKLPEQKQALEELFDKETFSEADVVKHDNQVGNLLTFLTDLSKDVAYVGADIIVTQCISINDKLLTWAGDKKAQHHKVAKNFFDVVMDLTKTERGK